MICYERIELLVCHVAGSPGSADNHRPEAAGSYIREDYGDLFGGIAGHDCEGLEECI